MALVRASAVFRSAAHFAVSAARTMPLQRQRVAFQAATIATSTSAWAIDPVTARVQDRDGRTSSQEIAPRALREFELSGELLSELEREGVEELFPVQVATLEHTLAGHDLVVRSRTGSGKTLGFAIPIIDRLMRSGVAGGHPRCVVLAPTRELAKQVAQEFQRIAPRSSGLRIVTVYGGASISVQMGELSRGADVVVGTPGRMVDLLERDSLRLDKIEHTVLDEADEMLKMGFQEELDRILEACPKQRHSMLWSATVPEWVRRTSRESLDRPVFIDLVGDDAAKLPDTISHTVVRVADQRDRTTAVIRQVERLERMHREKYGSSRRSRGIGRDPMGSGRPDPGATLRVLIFTDTKVSVDRLCESLGRNTSLRAAGLHGGRSQADRERTLGLFRDGALPVLVATDVAARGLDVPSVTAVIHTQLPNSAEQFVHRTGRTGRAGASGENFVIATPEDNPTLAELERTLSCRFTVTLVPEKASDPAMKSTRRVVSTATSSVQRVDEGAVEGEAIRAAAKAVLEAAGGDADLALRRALAAALGFQSSVGSGKSMSLITGEVGAVTLALNNRTADGSVIAGLSRTDARAAIGDVYETAGLPRAAVPSDVFPSSRGVFFDVFDEESVSALRHTFPEDEGNPRAAESGDFIYTPDAIPSDAASSVFAPFRERFRGFDAMYGRGGGGGGRGRGGGGSGGRRFDDGGRRFGDRQSGGGRFDRRGGGSGDRFNRGGGGGGDWGDRRSDRNRGGRRGQDRGGRDRGFDRNRGGRRQSRPQVDEDDWSTYDSW